MPTEKRKKFFRSYSAVFQGGGCRVAAFAGAYRVAVESGLQFTEVAGASGGAIMAALIGAGATPDFILSCFKDLDFKKFLAPPLQADSDAIPSKWISLLSLLKPVKPNILTPVMSILQRGGIYSSSYVQKWVQERLAELLPDVRGDVKFSDLPIPTYIVATDLQGCKPKIWKPDDDEYVALAVRASCSIPLFFQPVRFGDNRFVDGGVLSNLPTFVFTAEKNLSRTVLAFQLQGNYVPVSDWSALGTSRRLIDAVVDGATELQQRLQRDVDTIVIRTGDVEATDFEKMTPQAIEVLIKAGVSATESFVEQEYIRARGIPPSQIICRTRDDAYAAITLRADNVFQSVIISQRDAEFIWKLFPVILFWRRKGHSIRVLLEPIRGLNENQRKYEMARRSLLKNLGTVVVETELLPNIGFVFDGTDDNRSGAVLYAARENEYLPFATGYFGAEHRNVVRAVFQEISRPFTEIAPSSFVPDIVAYDQNLLENELKANEFYYKKEGVTVDFESVSVNSLHLSSRYIRDFKYRQIELLVSLYKGKDFDLFRPAATSLQTGGVSIITPPVVEEHGTRKVVIEGNTRSLFCYLNGIEQIGCLVVRNLQDDLPSEPVEIKYGRVVSRELKPEERMPNLRRGLFRRIEDAMHPVAK